jgi:hypothetical protein
MKIKMNAVGRTHYPQICKLEKASEQMLSLIRWQHNSLKGKVLDNSYNSRLHQYMDALECQMKSVNLMLEQIRCDLVHNQYEEENI